MPKPSQQNKRNDYIYHIVWEIKGVSCLSQKYLSKSERNSANVVRTHYNVAVLYVSHSSSSLCHATSWNSLSLTLHLSLLSIAPGSSSRLHPISAQSFCILVLAGRPTFARPYWKLIYIVASFRFWMIGGK